MAQKDANISQFNKFLQNNQDFLQEKYSQHFKKKVFPIKQFNNQAGLKFIYDVFSFSKYQSDEKMNKTLKKSLTVNINDFLKNLPTKTKNNNEKQQFNLKLGVELLKYCIENNEMFAVKYDKKDKKIKTQHQEQEPTQQKQVENVTEQHKKEQIEEQPKQEQVQQEEQIQNDKQEHLEDSQLNNQFQMSRTEERKLDPATIKKNLKQVFQFYCKQQQNIGVNSTFDRISQECQTMNLGKFLCFASTAGIKSDLMEKKLLMRKYKMTAQGKKQIDFQKFYQLINVLAVIDETLIPKLGVDDKNTYKLKMKQRILAFNTKDLTFRQLKKPHIFIPKLTGHSGKMAEVLFQQMKLKKQMRVATSLVRQPSNNYHQGTPSKDNRYNISKLQGIEINNSKYMSPKELAGSNIRDFNEDLDFLQQMINVQQADEQWLQDYKIPKKASKVVSQNGVQHSKEAEIKIPLSLLAHNKISATTFLPRINSQSKRSPNLESNLDKGQTKKLTNLDRRNLKMNYDRRRERSSLA